MKRWKKALLVIAGTITLAAMLPLVWVASNAVSALYYLVFTTQPTEQELTGKYEAIASWGAAELVLHTDRTFEESLIVKGKEIKKIRGTWTSSSGDLGHAAQVDMSPDLQITQDAFGQQYNTGTHNFYKPRVGQVFAELDPDLGVRFIKRKH